MPKTLTLKELQFYVDYAQALLHIDCAYRNGIIEQGLPVSQARCQARLEEGALRGIAPRPDALEWFLEWHGDDKDHPFWGALYQ